MFPDGGPDGEVETTHLGQFTDDNAGRISEALAEAEISHWWKVTGRFARVVFAGDWGTHLFVDVDRLDDARRIAAEVTGSADRPG